MESKDKDLLNLPNMYILDEKPADDVWPPKTTNCHREFTAAVLAKLKERKINILYAICPVTLYNGKQHEMQTRRGLADSSLNDALNFIADEVQERCKAAGSNTFMFYYACLSVSVGIDCNTFQIGGDTTFFYTTYRGTPVYAQNRVRSI